RTHRMRVESGWWLHRRQRQQLKQMVRHHVAQRTGGVVETATVTDADFLVDRDLYMVDVVAAPDRLRPALGRDAATPPCGRRNHRAWRRESFRQRGVVCASEGGRTGPRSATRPAPR